MDETKMRRCRLGELRRVARVSLPEICARPAKIASRTNSHRGSEVYRENDLARAAQGWRKATVAKYARGFREKQIWVSPVGSWTTCVIGGRGCIKGRCHWWDGRMHVVIAEGKCRLGYVVGVTRSSLAAPRHILQWTSKFTTKLVKRGPGGEVCAVGEMVDHMSLSRGFYAPFEGLGPGMAGLEDSGMSFTRLRTKKKIAEKYSAPPPLGIQQALRREAWATFIGCREPKIRWID